METASFGIHRTTVPEQLTIGSHMALGDPPQDENAGGSVDVRDGEHEPNQYGKMAIATGNRGYTTSRDVKLLERVVMRRDWVIPDPAYTDVPLQLLIIAKGYDPIAKNKDGSPRRVSKAAQLRAAMVLARLNAQNLYDGSYRGPLIFPCSCVERLSSATNRHHIWRALSFLRLAKATGSGPAR